MKTWFVATLIVCAVSLSARAEPLQVQGDYHPLADEFEYLLDPGGTLTLEQLRSHPELYPFKDSADSKPPAGYTPVWLRLTLGFSPETLDKNYYLFAMVENIFEVRMYRPDASGGYHEWLTGNHYPASSREQDSPRYGFSIDPASTPTTVYMRVIGGPSTNNFPWVLVEEEAFLEETQIYSTFNLVCLTAVGTLLLFNLSLALSLRKAEYTFYTIYVTSVLMALLTLGGWSFYHLWPDQPWLNSRAMHSFNLVSALARLLAVVSLLRMAQLAPGLHRYTQIVLGALLLTLLVVVTLGVEALPVYAASVVWGVGIVMGFVVCVYAIRLRVRLAVPLLIALLLPALAAAVQGVLTVTGTGEVAIVMRLAKVGFVAHVLMFSLCLATQIKTESESRLLALHDELTGLTGPTLLRERFEQLLFLSRRNDWKIAVLFLDLDGFKPVNDGYGHAAGDLVLQNVASRMQSQLRKTDTVARLGGDEFVVLLAELEDFSSVSVVADKLLAAVSAPYRIDESVVSVTASMGIACFPDDGEDLQSLLKLADGAMYQAKAAGKNNYRYVNAAAMKTQRSTQLKVVASQGPLAR
ncbi:MAG: diguanylate cyclase [Halieaceae bacterium]